MSSPVFKSKGYLNFLGDRPCCVSGSYSNVDLHHEALLRKFSGRRKNKFDFGALPLDHNIHLNQRHAWGRKVFWEYYNLNPYQLAMGFIREYLTTLPGDQEMAENALEAIEDVWKSLYT